MFKVCVVLGDPTFRVNMQKQKKTSQKLLLKVAVNVSSSGKASFEIYVLC